MTMLLRYAVTLFALQVLFNGVVFLISDYQAVALLASLPFFALVWAAGRALAREGASRHPITTAACAAAAALIWQLPGLQGTVRFLSDMVGWTQYDGITDLQDFAMQTWHTVALPLLAAIPPGQVGGYYARYYFGLLAASPLLVLLFVSAAATGQRAKR